MTKHQQARFSELLDAQIQRGPLLGAERAEYDRLCDQWENENPTPRTMYPEFM